MPFSIRRLFMLAGVLFFSGCLGVKLQELQIRHAAGSEALGWKQVAREAAANNPDLHEARFQVESAARSRDIALSEYLPSAEGSLDRSYSRTSGTGPSQDGLGLGLTVTQPLFTGLRITGDFLKARRDLEAEEYAYLDTSAQVRFRLRSVYIDLMRLERLLETFRNIEERRKKNADLIQLRYEAGREHLGSSLRARAIAGQAAFDVRQTERLIQSQSMRMSRELGGDFIVPFHAEGDLEALTPKLSAEEPDFSKLAEKNPRVQQALKTAEGLKAGVLSAQGELWPQAEGVYAYGNSGETASGLRDDSFLGLRVSVPLFEGGSNIQGIRRAKSDFSGSMAAARSLRDETAVQQAEAWMALRNAVDAVEVRRRFLEASIERSDIIRSQYTTGLVNYQDFDLAEQDLSDSQKNYVEALAAALVREAEWDFSKGLTLEELLLEN